MYTHAHEPLARVAHLFCLGRLQVMLPFGITLHGLRNVAAEALVARHGAVQNRCPSTGPRKDIAVALSEAGSAKPSLQHYRRRASGSLLPQPAVQARNFEPHRHRGVRLRVDRAEAAADIALHGAFSAIVDSVDRHLDVAAGIRFEERLSKKNSCDAKGLAHTEIVWGGTVRWEPSPGALKRQPGSLPS